MSAPGTPDHPLRVAIIGSGPAAFYAAEALLKAPDRAVRVDMFDRLPTPYGLVRGGEDGLVSAGEPLARAASVTDRASDPWPEVRVILTRASGHASNASVFCGSGY